MGLDDGMAIELDAPLKDHGLDSLMAVELRNRIGGELKANLPSSMLFDHPSVQALTEHLLERLDLAGASPESAAPVAAPVAAPASPDGIDRLASIIAAIEALSDEDQELLVEKLAGSARGNP
jgi:acyl carrier protein